MTLLKEERNVHWLLEGGAYPSSLWKVHGTYGGVLPIWSLSDRFSSDVCAVKTMSAEK